MASEAQLKFADELRFHRESKNITLQQIASKTRIDLKFLQAIEDANFELLPEIYIRAFIKEYSQTLDLNPKEILQKYDEAKLSKAEEKPRTDEPRISSKQDTVVQEVIPPSVTSAPPVFKKEFGTSEIEPIPAIESPVKSFNGIKINYLIGIGILLAALIIIYFAFFTGSPGIVQEKTEFDTTDSNGERFEVKKAAPEEIQILPETAGSTVPQSPDSVYLSILTTDRVWVKVSADGKILTQQTEAGNAKLNFSAKKSFSVSVGNAGRVKVFFNNKPVENVGNPGEIRNLYLTTEGIKYYTIQPQKNEKKSSTKN
ncbi:MAG: RodZ domain-containing protein [Melioribacteraceae bacterium]